MSLTTNISTNILRDDSKDIDFIVTPNTKEIFERIFAHNYGANKSFNLIGNYGTGKSTFLWALEKNLNKEKIFFNNIEKKENITGYEFIKIIGENNSFANAISKELRLRGKIDNSKIVETLEKRRLKALKANKGLVLVVDEFGKFLEYASKNKATDELFLLQQISEWANDDTYETYFIITLHQNFSSYGNNLSNQDKLEWEKVKGRFVDLLFNEPVEQLIYFASKKLREFQIPIDLKSKFHRLLEIVKDSKLVSHNTTINEELGEALYPLDWLSANVLVNSLQRYGQNERSLFSFLNDDTEFSIKKYKNDFYSVSDVFNYLVNTMPTEINALDNPHRPQWHSTFRSLERAELSFNENYNIAADVIKTIGLVNIFSKAGGQFDKKFIVNYFETTRDLDVTDILTILEKSGIIRFYKHSNKINFLEGTDIDLEQELINVAKEINPDFSISNEIFANVEFPIILVKKYSFETGTPRFFEFKVLKLDEPTEIAEGPIDGYINLIFEDAKTKDIKSRSVGDISNVYVLYENSEQIKNEIFTIKKFDLLIEKHQSDINALKLLKEEREFHLEQLKYLVVNQLFNNNINSWIYDGKKENIFSKHKLYEWLAEICYKIYPNTPILVNELINKEYLSSPINAARKSLIRNVLENETLPDLDFPENKFPPEKAIYISLLKETGIHKLNKKIDYYELSKPKKDSELYGLWMECTNFLESSLSNKRNLRELYELLGSAPYKLKKGFIEFWIPLFLIAKREDYALFHIEGGYIPFLNEDTIDIIHKKPQDFLIKSYDVSGLKVNLLESYKELVQIDQNIETGTQSIFLSIFSNFLRFQRGLNYYTMNTSKLSKPALNLREAISKAKDPEDALFNYFPAALGFHSIAIKEDVAVLERFTELIQESIREIRTAFDELLNRIEKTITESFYCSSISFPDYKDEIQLKLEGINHGVLGKVQGIYYKRLVSPLDDRISWIKSVADVALGKGIEGLIDDEEIVLQDNIKDLSFGLIKASEIHKFNQSTNEGKLFSFNIISESGQLKEDKFIVSKSNSINFITVKETVEKELFNLDKQAKKQLLFELLSNEINQS